MIAGTLTTAVLFGLVAAGWHWSATDLDMTTEAHPIGTAFPWYPLFICVVLGGLVGWFAG
jgi:TRAP-type C4-dicarboxylate transport system permease small subunit